MSKCISTILELSPDYDSDGNKKLDKIIDYLITYIANDETLRIYHFPFLGKKLPKRPGEFVGALKKFEPVFWPLDQSTELSLDVLNSEGRDDDKLLFLITDKKLPDYRIKKSIKKAAESKIPFYIFSLIEQISYEGANIIILEHPDEFYSKSKEIIYG
jgi:hypothetical protein